VDRNRWTRRTRRSEGLQALSAPWHAQITGSSGLLGCVADDHGTRVMDHLPGDSVTKGVWKTRGPLSSIQWSERLLSLESGHRRRLHALMEPPHFDRSLLDE